MSTKKIMLIALAVAFGMLLISRVYIYQQPTTTTEADGMDGFEDDDDMAYEEEGASKDDVITTAPPTTNKNNTNKQQQQQAAKKATTTTKKKEKEKKEQGKKIQPADLAAKLKLPLPWMRQPEIDCIINSITNETLYVEFGSGGSTWTYAIRAKTAISVEHNPAWCEEVKQKLKSIGATNVQSHCVTVEKGHHGWGGGFEEGTFKQFEEYVDMAHKIGLEKDSIDVVLDDGRARVAVALSIFPYVKPNGIVFIHDYAPRKYYWIVEKYYDKIYEIETLVKLRRKPGVAAPTREEIFKLA